MPDYVEQAVLSGRPIQVGIVAHLVDLAERGLLTTGGRDRWGHVVVGCEPDRGVGLTAGDLALLGELRSRSEAGTTEWSLPRGSRYEGARRLEGRARDRLTAAGLLEPRPAVGVTVLLAVAVTAGLLGVGWMTFGGAGSTSGGSLLLGAITGSFVLMVGWVPYDILRRRVRPTATGRAALADARRAGDPHRLAPLLLDAGWPRWSGLRSDTPPSWLAGTPWPTDEALRQVVFGDVLRELHRAFQQKADRSYR